MPLHFQGHVSPPWQVLYVVFSFKNCDRSLFKYISDWVRVVILWLLKYPLTVIIQVNYGYELLASFVFRFISIFLKRSKFASEQQHIIQRNVFSATYWSKTVLNNHYVFNLNFKLSKFSCNMYIHGSSLSKLKHLMLKIMYIMLMNGCLNTQ